MITNRRRVSTTATGLGLVTIMLVAPFVSPTASSWLAIAAMAVVWWPILSDVKSPAAIAVGHFGLIASCFALGVHDQHRGVWLTLATFTALLLTRGRLDAADGQRKARPGWCLPQ